MSTRTSPVLPADDAHPHKHWNQPRLPGRAVRRRQLHAAGAYKPHRHSRGKGLGGRGPAFLHGNLLAPKRTTAVDFISNLFVKATRGRMGGNR